MSGEKFIEGKKNLYDVVVVDSTNFSEINSLSLYSVNFYKKVYSLLKKDGIIITLGASFLDAPFIKKIKNNIKKAFKNTAIYRFCMPSYHCGEYCFVGGAKNIRLKKIETQKINQKFEKLKTKYKFKDYSPEIHKTSLILPFDF